MNPQTEIVWESGFAAVFLNLCIDLRRLGMKPGTPHWLETFEARYGIDQYKIHWDELVKQWKSWRNLLQSSDMEWDPETQKFIVSDEDFSKFLEVDPFAGKKLPPPEMVEKLKIIFEGCSVDGEYDDVGPNNGQTNIISHQDKEEEEEEVQQDDYDQEEDDDNQALGLPNIPNTRRRSLWSKALNELLVDLFFQETQKRRKPSSHFPKETWDMIREKVNATAENAFTLKFLKGRRDLIRKNWRSWCQLVNDASMKWDPITRTFGATKEDWKLHLKGNQGAAEFRKKVIACDFEEKLAIIYKGDIERGTPYVSHRYRRVQVPSEPPQPRLHEPTPLPTIDLNEPVVTTGNEDNVEPSDGRPICTPLEAESLRSHIVASPIDQCEYTIGECIELLDGIENIERGSDLYLFALDLFLESEFREMFVQLEEPRARMHWLLSNLQDLYR